MEPRGPANERVNVKQFNQTRRRPRGGPHAHPGAQAHKKEPRPQPGLRVVLCCVGESLGLANVDAVLDALGELDGAGREGEQGVVLADAHVVTGVDVGAALADENLAGLHELTAVALGAEALSLGIAAF